MTKLSPTEPEPTSPPGPQTAAMETAATMEPIDSIVPWKDNPKWKTAAAREKLKEHVRELAKAMKRFGFGACITARLANREIIAGHARRLAALRCKMTHVPVRFLDLSEDEAHAMALSDNRIGEDGIEGEDEEALAKVVQELEDHDVDLETGMGNGDDLADLLASEEEDEDDVDLGDGGSGGLVYKLLVTCKGEEDQAKLCERLEAEGYVTKPMMS